jgi:ABC-type arginine transport system ATPase subunit
VVVVAGVVDSSVVDQGLEGVVHLLSAHPSVDLWGKSGAGKSLEIIEVVNEYVLAAQGNLQHRNNFNFSFIIGNQHTRKSI